jgi:D-amino peptidase
MRVFISIDMEGVAGVVDRRQVWRGTDDFPEARRLMAGEANAVVDGCFAAGATEVVVNDSHGDMSNLVPSEVDPRARLQIGGGKGPHSMVFRADDGFDAAMFVGYHAMAGTCDGVLDHSYASASVSALRIGGEEWGEAQLNAAVLASWGVPLVLVTGDDKVCAQVSASHPGVLTCAVKDGQRNQAARSLSPADARAALRQAAVDALTAPRPALVRPSLPTTLEVDLLTTAQADIASLPPGVERIGPRTVRVSADSIDALSRWRGTITTLAGAV